MASLVDGNTFTRDTEITLAKIQDFLGSFIRRRLLSDDYLYIELNHKDHENKPINDFASTLLHEPIYGRCILVDKDEL